MSRFFAEPQRCFVSGWFHVAVLWMLVVGVVAWLGPLNEPILGDRAYFVYLGQAVLRGEAIYARTFFGYPPMAPLVTAGAMWIGNAFDLPTYASPRFGGIAILLGSVALAYRVTRHATRSALGGAVAGLALAGFSYLLTFSLAGIEPKAMVILLSLAGAACVQSRRWFWAGLASGLAGLSWQPGIVPAVATFTALLGSAGEGRGRAVGRYAAGMALSLLPTLAYLAATDGWLDFWELAFVIPARGQLPGSSGLHWLRVLVWFWSTEMLFFAAAAFGFAAALLRAAAAGPRRFADWFLCDRMGGMPLMTVGWIAFNVRDFQGPPDMLPILPTVAFWVGWGARPMSRLVASRPRVGRPAAVLLIVALAVYGIGDALLHDPAITLEEERRRVRSIVAPANPERNVVALGAAEVYVLEEIRSPLPFLVFNAYFVHHASDFEKRGDCLRYFHRQLGPDLAVAVVQRHARMGMCARAFDAFLRGSRRWESRIERLPWRRHVTWDPRDSEPSAIEWSVHTRRDRVRVLERPAVEPAATTAR